MKKMFCFYFSGSEVIQFLESPMKVVNLGILVMSSTFVQFSNLCKLVYTETTTLSLSGYINPNDARPQQIHS